MPEYTFDTNRYPRQKPPESPDLANGVYIRLDLNYEPILEKIEQWFADRDEVVVVDHGTSDKTQKDGFILMEWTDYEIDPAFLKILENDNRIIDYTTYSRELEEI
jgi:hypothetical protein